MARPLIQLPEQVRNRKNEIDTVISLVEGGSKLYKTGREFWGNHFAYSVVVSERDLLYAEVHNWLITSLPKEKNHALAVSTSRMSRNVIYDSPDDEERVRHRPSPLTVRFNESRPRTIRLNGHRIRITLSVPENSTESLSREPEPSKIEFVARTHEGQKVVLRLLEKLNSQRVRSRKPTLQMVGQWSGWTTRSDLPPRTLDSVSLPADQKERIVADLRFFLDAEEKYNRLAIPWHRGYMFHGPPGTGKTSLVRALAHEFSLDLWYISLSDLKAEASLLSLLAEVRPRGLLLLEDIDTVQITHDRDSSEDGKTISMGSLLNTLDGVATPHGLITVMTTNRFEILDSALTRAGRMDLIEELGYPTLRTLADMFHHFYGVDADFTGDLDYPLEGLSTSQVAEVMKRHMSDPAAARTAIYGMIP